MKPQVSGALEVPADVAAATPTTLGRAAAIEAAPFTTAIDDEFGPATTRVDLIFYDVDHSGPSYEARVFVNKPNARADTARDVEHGYVGSFSVFGHGGCYGDVGHCDIDQGTHDDFDVRPPHALTPWTRTVIVPPEVIGLLSGESVSITVVAVAIDENSDIEPRFSRVRLAAYGQ